MNPTPDFVEREYNNRALVPDHPDYFARWERDSKYVRETVRCTLDLPYGPDPRHRIDLFHAENPRGTLVFIHGGYWRSLDKSMFSWLAAPWVAAGIDVAMPNYRLCPIVGIEDIVADMRAAVNWLMKSPSPSGTSKHDGVGVEGRGEGPIVLSGHSAGGHLVGAIFATPLADLAFDPARIVGGVSLSGVFDFAPIKLFSQDFHLDDDAVARLNLGGRKPTIPAPLIAAAGADESSEFRRQTQLIADAWTPQARPAMFLPGVNHFSIVDAFSERGQPLYEATLALFPTSPRT